MLPKRRTWTFNGGLRFVSLFWVLCYPVLSRFSHKRLCNPMDCSPPGSSVNGILQARILEWVANSFSRGSSWPRDRTLSLTTPALTGRFSTTSATWETSLLSRQTLFFSKCVLPYPFASQPDITCTTSNRIHFEYNHITSIVNLCPSDHSIKRCCFLVLKKQKASMWDISRYFLLLILLFFCSDLGHWVVIIITL